MSSIREKAKARSAAAREEILHLPELDEDILVTGMTVMSRSECRSVFVEGQKATPQQNTAFLAAVVISHTLDPVTREPIFEPADADWLMQCDPAFIDKLVDKVYELSGFNSKDPVKQAEKNSETTGTSETSSN